jgi:hypothetical protein
MSTIVAIYIVNTTRERRGFLTGVCDVWCVWWHVGVSWAWGPFPRMQFRPRSHPGEGIPRVHPLCHLRCARGNKGYEGAGIGVRSPVKGRDLHVDNRSFNTLLTAVRAIGERVNAELKGRWRCLQRIGLCPNRIGTIVAAALILFTLQRGNYRENLSVNLFV